MHYLDALFVGDEYRTCVWISETADAFLTKKTGKGHDRAINELLDKIKYWAKQGFGDFEGGEGFPIKREPDGVYRLGRHASLFRLLGFYENDDKRRFLIIDGFLKLKVGSARHEKERIRQVGLVKKAKVWAKTGK